MNNLEALIWVVMALAGISSTIMVTIVWGIKNYLRTKSGKTIDSAKSRHRQLVLAATPDHHGKLLDITQFIPGVSESSRFSQRDKKKRRVFFSPKKTDVTLSADEINKDLKNEEDRKKALQLTQECLTHMLKVNTEKVFLEEGVPVTLAIEDKVVTAGVKGIGALAFYEKLTRIDKIKEKIQDLKKSETLKEVGVYLEELASKVSLIDINVLRNYWDSDYDQTDEESKNEWHYMQGYRDGQKKEKGFEKWIIIGGIGMGIAGIVGGLAFAFLSK